MVGGAFDLEQSGKFSWKKEWTGIGKERKNITGRGNNIINQ